MRAIWSLLLLLPGLWSPLAIADDDLDDEEYEGSVTGKVPPPLSTLKRGAAISSQDAEEIAALDYEIIVHRGADILGLEPAYVNDARSGLELIYLRDYKAAKDHFSRMSKDRGDSALGPIGSGLIWQALMLENFDFRYEKQFEADWKEARRRLEASLRVPGDEAWEYFLLAGVMGVDAIHMTRKGNFVTALTKGFEAIRTLGRCRDLAPDFPDLMLGDGIYNYWRSVVTMNSKLLPAFEDNRAEGLEQLQKAEAEAIFLGPPTTMALTFSYLEERKLRQALQATQKNYRKYPDNVINNMLMARVYMNMRKYDQAERILHEVIEDAPNNERVHYYLALVYSRSRRLDQAIVSLDTYLDFSLSKDQRAHALYRQGSFYYRKKEYPKAWSCYEESWKSDKHKGARRRMDTMAKMRKDGRIDF